MLPWHNPEVDGPPKYNTPPMPFTPLTVLPANVLADTDAVTFDLPKYNTPPLFEALLPLNADACTPIVTALPGEK